ncbi:hypothetical protein [Streptomyces sp. SP2-10]|uniref:class I SAM-dependent methyltransferase n=1 Tax=Streptomyces sp. SP2-10 TaxID=2873385 RepID=UPI0027E19E42|nr:hypothetical protein [Streptomyces sp. SP2-10]
MGFTRTDWSQHYTDGRGFRPLGEEEKALLTEHVPAPENGRALDTCCGTGELAVFLNRMGYSVDAVDFAEGWLNARNRVWLARRRLPRLLIPVNLAAWAAVTLWRTRGCPH